MRFKSNFFHLIEKLKDLWNFKNQIYIALPLSMQEEEKIKKLLTFYPKYR